MITHVAEGGKEDVDLAVAAARKAFDEGPWPKMTAYVTIFFFLVLFVSMVLVQHPLLISNDVYVFTQERSLVLLRFADLLEKHTEELAKLETWDNGKPYEQALNVELPICVRLIRYYAGISGLYCLMASFTTVGCSTKF